MNKSILVLITVFGLMVSATDMVIDKTDGSSESIPIDEIDSITFSLEEHEPPQRILFIGNSYTYTNGGIDYHLQELVLSAYHHAEIVCDNITAGGATLESHYNNANTLQTILDGNWDIVILQEQSTRPINNPQLFYQYATLLDEVITTGGAETAFFMTWAREYDPEMIEGLAFAYNHIGDELEAIVVPVGRAFQLSLDQDPNLTLHVTDGSHPNVHGTYLAVCTFFASFWQESPVGIDYVNDDSITHDEREFLQTIAWETIQVYGP
ncbi:MAG: hypothetical protein H8E57_11645 [Candidatus Cloacimonetes bacterium]|nr:hypothetical protein [Candidatus Cloacimonadota bacterium]